MERENLKGRGLFNSDNDDKDGEEDENDKDHDNEKAMKTTTTIRTIRKGWTAVDDTAQKRQGVQ